MITAGQQLLWSIIKHEDTRLFSSLQRNFFSNRKDNNNISETDLFDFIVTHRNEYRKLPNPHTLMQNSFPYEETPEATEYYFIRASNRLIRNKTITHAKAIEDILKSNQGYENIKSLTNEYLRSISEITVNNKFKTLIDVAEGFVRDLDQANDGVVKKMIPFGWETLDKLSSGGMMRRRCYICSS